MEGSIVIDDRDSCYGIAGMLSAEQLYDQTLEKEEREKVWRERCLKLSAAADMEIDWLIDFLSRPSGFKRDTSVSDVISCPEILESIWELKCSNDVRTNERVVQAQISNKLLNPVHSRFCFVAHSENDVLLSHPDFKNRCCPCLPYLSELRFFYKYLPDGSKRLSFELQEQSAVALQIIREKRKLIFSMEDLELTALDDLERVPFLADDFPWRYRIHSPSPGLITVKYKRKQIIVIFRVIYYRNNIIFEHTFGKEQNVQNQGSIWNVQEDLLYRQYRKRYVFEKYDELEHEPGSKILEVGYVDKKKLQKEAIRRYGVQHPQIYFPRYAPKNAAEEKIAAVVELEHNLTHVEPVPAKLSQSLDHMRKTYHDLDLSKRKENDKVAAKHYQSLQMLRKMRVGKVGKTKTSALRGNYVLKRSCYLSVKLKNIMTENTLVQSEGSSSSASDDTEKNKIGSPQVQQLRQLQASISSNSGTKPCKGRRCGTCSLIAAEPVYVINGMDVKPASGDCSSYCIIYIFMCKLCTKNYVGSTIRTLKSAVNSHRNFYYQHLSQQESILSKQEDPESHCVGKHLIEEHGQLHRSDFNESYQIFILENSSSKYIHINDINKWIYRLKTIKPHGINYCGTIPL